MSKKKKKKRPQPRPSIGPTPADSSVRSEESPLTRLSQTLMLIVLAVLGLLIYAQTLENPFVFDDGFNILNNPGIRLTELSWDGLNRAAWESPSRNRPVAYVSFALNYYFHRYQVVGYHVVNILIHLAAALILFFLAQRTLTLPGLHPKYESQARWIAFFAALVWMVHPLNVQSVTYIVQRMNSLTAMFYLLAMLLYVQGRLTEKKEKRLALFAGCGVAGLLALGSKENAATLPFMLFLYEWFFFQNASWSWLKSRWWLPAGIVLFFLVAAFLFLGIHPLAAILHTYGHRDFTLTERVLTQFRVVIFYLGLFFFPHPSRLNLTHDFSLSHSLLSPPTTLLALAGLLGLAALAVITARKDRLVSFALLWFLGNLAIESSVVGSEIIFEHRTYLPSMMVSLLVVALVFRFIKPKVLNVGLFCLIAAVLSLWTFERNLVWRDEVTLWRDCVAKSPDNARAHNNLGLALAKRGDTVQAIEHYRKALALKPDHPEAHNNLGLAFSGLGRYDQALRHYQEALKDDPLYVPALNNLGKEMRRRGRLNEAASHYRLALEIQPDSSEVHNNLGVALAVQGRLQEAIEHFQKALTLDPGYLSAARNLDRARKILAEKSKAPLGGFD